MLAVVICANFCCCAAFGGIAFGYSVGRGRASNVPAAVGEGAALVGEVAAVATARAAREGRRRIAGYAVDAPAINAR